MRIKICILGLRNAGKTSIIESFCGLPIDKIKGIQLVVDNNLISVKFYEYDKTNRWYQYKNQIINNTDNKTEEEDHKNNTPEINLFADDEKMIEDCQCFMVVYNVVDTYSCSLVPIIIDNIYKIKELPPLSIPITIIANK
eukprot:321312_1